MIRIKRGLDLPITGVPRQTLSVARAVHSVALLGADYHGLKPSLAVQVGDRVKIGQTLFFDKATQGVRFTAPAAGVVSAIHRGARRVFQAVVIAPESTAGETEEAIEFARHDDAALAGLSAETVVENLAASGLWTALRTRPFSRTPALDARPASLFVTAIDTHPLAANPGVVIAAHGEDFRRGIVVLSRLAPKVFVCADASTDLPCENLANVTLARFSGPHPAGLPGTHIHFLDPVHANRSVWHIGYQDVIAVGKLFATGRLWVSRVVALAGPAVKEPRLIETRLGANLAELAAGEVTEGENRLISGSVLGGRTASEPLAFLGRFHTQISVLREGRARELLSFFRAGSDKFSLLPVFASAFTPKKKFAFTTSTNGSPRAMVPLGNYEAVMPLDILPTQLLRYLVVGDSEMAQKLGALELDEEDLALCSCVCAGKYEYGPILRDVLTRIEKEG